MTAYAGGRRALVSPTHVASRAIQGGVHSGESEPSKFQVIELRAQPSIDGVALLTLDGKTRSDVIGLGGLLIGALMTGVALDRKSLELSDSLALVAVRTVQSGMSSHQRETVVVFPHPLQNDVPSLHRMTLCAVGPHLPTMNVSVAVGAVRSGI